MRSETVRWARRFLLTVIVVAGVAAGLLTWQAAQYGEGPSWLETLLKPAQTLTGLRVGIVAGHSDYDSGAVCPDGLTEAQVNRAVAERTVRELQRRGASVDLLTEFDSRLRGYRADAFVSIHADSCTVDLSGFKVASLEGGSQASAALVKCLWDQYAAVTRLAAHPDTVTYDMTGYHAFREIAPGTPAAIIETGFLNGDRRLLTGHPDRVATGIVRGVECFLKP